MNRQLSTTLALLIAFASLTACVSTLESAVESGDYDAVRQEISSGGNVDGNYWTTLEEPIYRAIGNDDLRMVELLHQGGAKIPADSLSAAAKAGSYSVFEYLIKNGNDIAGCHDDLDYPGFWDPFFFLPNSYIPPLGSAIAHGHHKAVRVLVDLGAPIEQECKKSESRKINFSAIVHAAYFGNVDIVRLMIFSGANPNRIQDGMTPLSIAAEYGHTETARMLLANGAFHTYSNDVKQPMEFALEGGHEDVVQLLVYAGAVRPKTIRASEIFEGVVDTLVKGVVVVGTVALLVEGAKYYAHASDEMPEDSSRDMGRAIGSMITSSSKNSNQSPETGECRSDLDCGGLEVCVKKPLHSGGICVQNPNARLDPDRDSVESSFPRWNSNSEEKDCPLGTRWDLIYKACIN